MFSATGDDRHENEHLPFGAAYAGRRVFVTGHTGFKGSWLCEWLLALGADVTGLSLRTASRIKRYWRGLCLSGLPQPGFRRRQATTKPGSPVGASRAV